MAGVQPGFVIPEQIHEGEVAHPLLDIDHLTNVRNSKGSRITSAHDPEHADEISPIIFGGVGLLEPGVLVGAWGFAAIAEIWRGDVPDSPINISRGIVRE